MDSYIYVIVALLPLSAVAVVLQVNPYQALVIRGILGAVAALIYAVLGAADVALTEALVGTMLAITLYVVAVRSSLIMRLGILQTDAESERYFTELIAKIRKIIKQHYLRLEIIEYSDTLALETALQAEEIHAICVNDEQKESSGKNGTAVLNMKQTYQTKIRVRRLFEIMEQELVFPDTTVNYIAVNNKEKEQL